jgi:hypothetical protein
VQQRGAIGRHCLRIVAAAVAQVEVVKGRR